MRSLVEKYTFNLVSNNMGQGRKFVFVLISMLGRVKSSYYFSWRWVWNSHALITCMWTGVKYQFNNVSVTWKLLWWYANCRAELLSSVTVRVLCIDQFQLLPSPPPLGHTPGICKALCPGGGDFVQQRVAPGMGGGDNLTDRQTHPVARSVTMEEFAGKPTTFVGDWLEKQGIGKLKTLFEGKKHAYVNIFVVAFPLPGGGEFVISGGPGAGNL